MSAAYTAASLAGLKPRGVLAHGGRFPVECADGRSAQWPLVDRCDHHSERDAIRNTVAYPFTRSRRADPPNGA